MMTVSKKLVAIAAPLVVGVLTGCATVDKTLNQAGGYVSGLLGTGQAEVVTAKAQMHHETAPKDHSESGHEKPSSRSASAHSGVEPCGSPQVVLRVEQDSPSATDGQLVLANVLPNVKLSAVVATIVAEHGGGCFLVNRRDAALRAAREDKELADAGMLEGGDRTVAKFRRADLLLTPSVTLENNNSGGVAGAVAGYISPVLGVAAAGLRFQEAEVTVLLTSAYNGDVLDTARARKKTADWFAGLGGVTSGFGGGGTAYADKAMEETVRAAAEEAVVAMLVRYQHRYLSPH